MAQPPKLTRRALREAGLGSYFRPVDLQRIGIEEPRLRHLVREGVVDRVGWGLYRLSAAPPTEHDTLAAIAARIPQGAFCLYTALQFHGIGTRLSPQVWVGLPHGSQTPRISFARLRIVRFSGVLNEIGVDDIRLDGVPARITNPTRTVVDCLRLSRLVDREAALEAAREALRARRTTPAKILAMAEKCGSAGRTRQVLESIGT